MIIGRFFTTFGMTAQWVIGGGGKGGSATLTSSSSFMTTGCNSEWSDIMFYPLRNTLYAPHRVIFLF
jgi:hypothetical protein